MNVDRDLLSLLVLQTGRDDLFLVGRTSWDISMLHIEPNGYYMSRGGYIYSDPTRGGQDSVDV